MDHKPKTFRGVSYDSLAKKWRGRLYCVGQHITIGRYPTMEEAALAHDRAAYFLFGEEAETNFGTRSARKSLADQSVCKSWAGMARLEALAAEVSSRNHRRLMARDALRRHRKLAAIQAGLRVPDYDARDTGGCLHHREAWRCSSMKMLLCAASMINSGLPGARNGQSKPEN